MADSVNVQHKLQMLFETKLDEKSKQQVGKQIKGMLENAVISFDEAEARHNLESIIKMMNKLFSKAEMEGFDMEKLLKMPSQQALQAIASRATEDFQKAFDQALKKSGGIKIDFGNVDLSAMTEPLNQLAKDLNKIGDKIASSAEKSVSEIEESLSRLGTDKKISKATQNIEKLLTQKIKVPKDTNEAVSKLIDLRNTYATSRSDNDSWEIQYQHLLRYVRVYEAAQQKFGENLTADNPQLKDLYEMLSPKTKAVKISLENFVDKARGNELAEDRNKPWAREKTLQEVKDVLKNGITVNGKTGGDTHTGNNTRLNAKPEEPAKPEKTSQPKKQIDPVVTAIKGFIKQYIDMFDKLTVTPMTASDLQKLRDDMFASLLKSFKLKDGFDEDELFAEFKTFERDFDEKRFGTYLKKQIEGVASASIDSALKTTEDKVKKVQKEKPATATESPSATVAIDEAALENVLGRVIYKVKVEGEESKDTAEDNQIVQALGEISQKIDAVSREETLQTIKNTVDTTFKPKNVVSEGKIPPEVRAETSANREVRFERLSDFASMYEEVDDVEAAIKEFGELYKEIVLIGDEATKVIKPNKAGINVLKKIATDDLDFDYSWVEFKRAHPAASSEDSASSASKVAVDETSLENVLSRVIYKVKVEGAENKETPEDNKVAIDTEALQSVLNAITYNVKVVQDMDAPDDEKPNSIDTEALKAVLNAITYNVKIVYDDADKTANKITLDDSVLESTLNRVFADILHPQTPQNDGNAQEPWAREDTLGAVKGVLENIQASASKIGASEAQPTVTIDSDKISSIADNLAEIKRVVEAINGKVVKGTVPSTQDSTGASGQIAKKNPITAKKNAATETVSEKKTVSELTKLYQQLGRAEARRDMVSWNVAEQVIADKEATAINELIEAKRGLIDINEELDNTFTDSWFEGVEKETKKPIEDLGKEYENLGRLRAKIDEMPDNEYTEYLQKQLKTQEKLVAVESRRLDISTDQQTAFNLRAEYARLNEIEKLEEKAIQDREAARKKSEKEQLKDKKKALKEEIRRDEENARMSKAGGIRGRAIDSITNVNLLDNLSKEAKDNIVQGLIEQISEFDKLRARIQNGDPTITQDDIERFKKFQVEIDKTSKELNEFATMQNLVANGSAIAIGDNIQLDPTKIEAYRQALENTIKTKYGGKATIGDFDYKTKQLNFTLNNGRREVTEYKMAWDQVMKTYVAIPGKTKKVEGTLTKILKKAKEFSAYFTGSSLIYKGWNELVKGVQYVREIDKALTELKKVTDETEASYERFMNTASKTASKVGSTLTNIVNSTADWARIGYSLADATTLAESTAVLLNVSEFRSIDEATSALTSTLQAFSYTADQSLDVVDVLNEVGKLVARR